MYGRPAMGGPFSYRGAMVHAILIWIKDLSDEADFPALEPRAQTAPWFLCAQGDAGWPQGIACAPQTRPQVALRVSARACGAARGSLACLASAAKAWV